MTNLPRAVVRIATGVALVLSLGVRAPGRVHAQTPAEVVAQPQPDPQFQLETPTTAPPPSPEPPVQTGPSVAFPRNAQSLTQESARLKSVVDAKEIETREALANGELLKAESAAANAETGAQASLQAAVLSGDGATIDLAMETLSGVSSSEGPKAKVEDAKSICSFGREWWRPCLFAGAFLASASLTGVNLEKGGLHGGETSHSIISTIIPTAGARWPLETRARISLDLGLLSMLLSKDLSSSSRKGCRTSDGEYEQKLPCEGNVALSPIGAGYLGLTFGTEDVGLVTFMYMIGMAKTSLDNTMYRFHGAAIGLISLNKIINLAKGTK